MATDRTSLREHTTDDINMQLLSDDAPINLATVHHLRFDLIDNVNNVYRYLSNANPSYLTITDAANGKISFTPPSEDIFLYIRSPYKVAVWVWVSPTKRYAVPGYGYGEISIEKEY